MELSEARAVAAAFLESMESPGEPLRLATNDEQVADVGWAWVFAWSTAQWFDTGQGRPPVGGGPIVVVKATRDSWMLGSATPYDEQLTAYAAERGLEHVDPGAEPATKLAAWLTVQSPARPDPVTAADLATWRRREVQGWWLFEMPGFTDTMFLVGDGTVHEFHPSRTSVDEALAAAGGTG
ncbi:YrhB domain-containing protein [Kribbella sp. VKM Ac-2566]|uniref:YrhB domain-containing protein n=1 Tax=Kribbella sp. VKM Ac-2566 TaxID=2512218 RepID=UPI001063CD3A|nr:YrhB domain-containing protein [Kribbella sp. VKM Ac-2566]TDW92709.1 immunity protein 35 of polymorphic toxin system [Kribbella sp. VKM Ac-2566]